MIGRIVRRRPYRRPRSGLSRRPCHDRAMRRLTQAVRLVPVFTAVAGLVAAAILLAGTAAYAAEPAGPTVLAADSITAVVNNIRAWLVGILVAVATLFLTIGGLRLMWANGDPGEAEKGKAALKSAAIGYALALLSPLIVTVVAGWAKGPCAHPPSAPAPAPGVPPSPDKTPAPPQSTPSPIPPPTDSTKDPGMFDIPGQIRKAINDFIAWIAKTGLKPVLDALSHTVLSTPHLTDNPQVKAIWTTSLVTANAIFVLFIIAGGFIIASRETLQSSYGLKEIAPRVVVSGVAANVSLVVCGKAIEATNALTAAIVGQGVDGNGAATALNQILNQPPSPNMPPILFSLLILAALVMAIVVLVTFILRTALLVLL